MNQSELKPKLVMFCTGLLKWAIISQMMVGRLSPTRNRNNFEFPPTYAKGSIQPNQKRNLNAKEAVRKIYEAKKTRKINLY